LERFIFMGGRTAPAGTRDRADGDHVATQSYENLWTRSGHGEGPVVEKEQEGCRIDPSQSAVERKRWQREWSLESLRQDDLEDVPGDNVFLCHKDHAGKLGRGRIGCGCNRKRSFERGCRLLVERASETADDRRNALNRPCKRYFGRDRGQGTHG